MNVFHALESEVRSYCRTWPTVFDRAQGSWVHDENGRAYLDFFAGAGTLNYGHNPPEIKRALLRYLERDGIAHSLDMFTVAKRDFLERFQEVILEPRGLDYKVQFPGPAGANAVEAALKLARKVTGRTVVVGFTNAFHGMTLGALGVCGNAKRRATAGVPLEHHVIMPFDESGAGGSPDPLRLESVLAGRAGDRPAAVIVEAVQGEGGVNVASQEWLRELAETCRRHGVLLIVDDIQMGCGRTGAFFSFEEAGITPDIVTLSKSISGYGLPLALTLFRPDLDVWEAGEHNGTFRGPNPSFVTATAALDFWVDATMEKQTLAKGQQVEEFLAELCAEHAALGAAYRGRGLVWGLTFDAPELAAAVSAAAFDEGLLVETSGPRDEVVKLLPPLTVTTEELTRGLTTIADAVRRCAARSGLT
ncbi:diaminobutyrate--2-oxoglutarate transaminase [Nonomuraea sp. NPDC050451]|uniref:diaminobutyrate--2-oxoglutarate transaminase n=1 Tax=Nonomuraea sp. NPDC050451 TaxID=3364364 RepID=UPI003796B1F8